MIGYHVWVYDKRRRRLFMLTHRTKDRWDQQRIPAYWENRHAALQWATRHKGKDGFKVIRCEGERCGMIDHGEIGEGQE